MVTDLKKAVNSIINERLNSPVTWSIHAFLDGV